MFKEPLCRKLKIIKKGDGKYVWLQFWDFNFLKKIKFAFNNYPSIDDGNAFDLKCYMEWIS
jgi:hypothetical protein